MIRLGTSLARREICSGMRYSTHSGQPLTCLYRTVATLSLGCPSGAGTSWAATSLAVRGVDIALRRRAI